MKDDTWQSRNGLRKEDGNEQRGDRNVVAAPSEEAVYLLDDDPSVLKATTRLLDSAGWEVESFTDPFAFLEHARVNQPRVVVIDIGMPEMDGLEVQSRLREVSPCTRVIVLTSKDDPAIRASAMNAGASAFFLKGLPSDELLAAIESAEEQS